MERRDKTIARKMLWYCKAVEESNLHFDNNKELFFDKDQGIVYRSAVSMPILQIGELAKHFSTNFIMEHTLVPWKEIIRMRDFFAHHYENASFSQIWDTAHDDIAELKSYLLSITEDIDENEKGCGAT